MPEPSDDRGQTLVLLSGGLDSSVMLRWLQSTAPTPLVPVFLNWGQRSIERESQAVKAVCAAAGLTPVTVDLAHWRAGFRPLFTDLLKVPRNAIFLHAVLPYAWAHRCGQIAIGSTTNDRDVIDSNQNFIDAINGFWARFSTKQGPQPQVFAPFLENDGGWDKVRIIEWSDARLGRGFVDLTHTCWDDPTCAEAGRDFCPACIKRSEALKSARPT